jgi:hypothetical protein
VQGIRSLALGLVLGIGVAWSGAGLVSEVRDAVEELDARAGNAVPFFWRFGMAPVERFARCMAAARPLLPPGSVVAFESLEGPREADFFRWRWAAYLLPEQHLVRARDARAGSPAAFLLTYRKEAQDPRYRLVSRLPGGRLYRLASGAAEISSPGSEISSPSAQPGPRVSPPSVAAGPGGRPRSHSSVGR